MTETAFHHVAETWPAARELTFRRRLRAPRPLVWRAWTEPERIARWWGPPGATTTVERLDLRPGGELRVTMRFDGNEVYAGAAAFREVSPPERLALEAPPETVSPCGAGLPPGAWLTLTLEEAGPDETELTLITRFDVEAALRAAVERGYEQGWAGSFDRLAASLAQS